MTTELTKAAQQALKPHQIAQLVNKLRDIAREFHAHDCLRELISQEVNSALTQRPAAQEVASYFSYGEDAGYLEHATAEAAREQAKADIRGYRNDAMHDNEWPSEVDSVCWGVVLQKATAVDNSEEAGQESFDYELGPAPQQATPERHLTVTTNQQGEAVMVSWQDDDHRILEVVWEREQAMPEPVAWFDNHGRLQSRVSAEQLEQLCRDAILQFELDQLATPEPVGEPLGYIPTDAIDQIKTPPRLITRNVPVLSYAADGYTAIYTRPAPGAPAHPITNSPERQP